MRDLSCRLQIFLLYFNIFTCFFRVRTLSLTAWRWFPSSAWSPSAPTTGSSTCGISSQYHSSVTIIRPFYQFQVGMSIIMKLNGPRSNISLQTATDPYPHPHIFVLTLNFKNKRVSKFFSRNVIFCYLDFKPITFYWSKLSIYLSILMKNC